MEDIVIVSAARTAVGKFGGSLAKTPATELGSIVIKGLLARKGGRDSGCVVKTTTPILKSVWKTVFQVSHEN